MHKCIVVLAAMVACLVPASATARTHHHPKAHPPRCRRDRDRDHHKDHDCDDRGPKRKPKPKSKHTPIKVVAPVVILPVLAPVVPPATPPVVPPVTTPRPPASPCPIPAPGATQTLGGRSYAQTGVDTFTKDQPSGPAWTNPSSSATVYTGDHGMAWTEYPDGWASTHSTDGYEPSTVQSVHDGMLDFNLHTNASGHQVGADPSPVPSGNQYQASGVWSMCEKVVPDPGSSLSDFHEAVLLWPQTQGDWQSAESDYPENDLNASTVSFFAHTGGSSQDTATAPQPFDTARWHVFTQTREPSGRCYYVDGNLVGCSTQAYVGPERWQLQMEPIGANTGGHGHVYVGWVWIGQ